ncbi:hypothetical protein BGZ57DRAFT_861108 [Hyaloscypha finlandica]|nr:hypothetical protein F5882DRAFT_488130 [Hyaloscypha sp. PMI_1271]KAH8750450.1 hypothetical protein BGZ57DRAFT_861108 [Hyaloscypha finlandica]
MPLQRRMFRLECLANLLPLSQQVPLPSLRQHHPSWIDCYRTHKGNTGAGRNEVITPRPIPQQALTADSGMLKHTVDVLLAKGDLIIGNLVTLIGGVGLWNTDGATTSVQPGRRTPILDPREALTGVDPAVLYSVF